MIGGWLQAGSRADRAVHVGSPTAAAADDVMVVVAGACLVACRTVGGLNSPHQTSFHQSIQVVVDSLSGERAQTSAGGDRNSLRIVMLGSRFDGGKHGEPWSGNAQTCITNTTWPVGFSMFHDVSIVHYLE